MKKFLGIVVLGLVLIFSSNVFAIITGAKYGKGPLKVTENVANVLEYYFSGGTRGVYAEKQSSAWKPGLIAVSKDGSSFSYFRHPATVGSHEVDSKHYGGLAVNNCQRKSGRECFLFAVGYKIRWDNGSDKKKRRLKRKDIRNGKTLDLLKELGFYDGYTQRISNINKKSQKIIENSDGDIVEKLKELKKLYDDGVLTKEEFEKAKKKLLN